VHVRDELDAGHGEHERDGEHRPDLRPVDHDGLLGVLGSTSEPTVQTQWKLLRITPNGGTYDYDWPLGETPDSPVSNGFTIRCTAPTSAVNVRASVRFERC
jgi:hypothetical protein